MGKTCCLLEMSNRSFVCLQVDLTNIKRAYWCLYNTELSADVKGDTSGDYRKLLVDLVEGF